MFICGNCAVLTGSSLFCFVDDYDVVGLIVDGFNGLRFATIISLLDFWCDCFENFVYLIVCVGCICFVLWRIVDLVEDLILFDACYLVLMIVGLFADDRVTYVCV